MNRTTRLLSLRIRYWDPSLTPDDLIKKFAFLNFIFWGLGGLREWVVVQVYEPPDPRLAMSDFLFLPEVGALLDGALVAVVLAVLSDVADTDCWRCCWCWWWYCCDVMMTDSMDAEPTPRDGGVAMETDGVVTFGSDAARVMSLSLASARRSRSLFLLRFCRLRWLLDSAL